LSNPSPSGRLVLGPVVLWFILGSVTGSIGGGRGGGASLTKLPQTTTTRLMLF